MKVYLASDHGGFNLKEELKSFLAAKGVEVEDTGNREFNKDDDYPEFVIPMAEKVASDWEAGQENLGIILGRSGNGEAMAANKVRGIRAAVVLSPEMAKKAREDNNANVVSLGADLVDTDLAKEMVNVFLTTPFSGEERHIRRVEMIKKYEDVEVK